MRIFGPPAGVWLAGAHVEFHRHQRNSARVQAANEPVFFHHPAIGIASVHVEELAGTTVALLGKVRRINDIVRRRSFHLIQEKALITYVAITAFFQAAFQIRGPAILKSLLARKRFFTFTFPLMGWEFLRRLTADGDKALRCGASILLRLALRAGKQLDCGNGNALRMMGGISLCSLKTQADLPPTVYIQTKERLCF